MQQKIQTFLNTCLRRIFNIRWPEKIRNEELWERAGQEPVAKQILRRKWGWIGHTLRKPASSTTRQALTWNPQGKRKRGRPRNSWRRDTEAELLLDSEEVANARRGAVTVLLESREPEDMKKLLSVIPDEGSKLDCMQMAAFFHKDVKLIKKLAELDPKLIWNVRGKGRYEGQTVLHIVIVQQNQEAAEFLLNADETNKDKMKLLSTEATGSMFDGTVMMGKLPLSVAALTFNLDMVELLIKNGAEISRGNKDGDTVFHTLVRFAELYPETQTDVVKMTLELHKLLLDQLKRAEELFELILNLEGVYRKLDDDDGFYDSLLYDVTEIDTVAFRRNLEENVMEILCETDSGQAGPAVINIRVIREIIKSKWIKYRPWFLIWAVLHVLFMILITTHAVYKAGLISDDLQGQPSSDAERNFVTAVAGISFGVPALVVPMELILLISTKQPCNLQLHHHNGLYRVLLLVFAISLGVDSIW
nr:hypothetical protein BaRGS_030181 [Batillaria attramentaria]